MNQKANSLEDGKRISFICPLKMLKKLREKQAKILASNTSCSLTEVINEAIKKGIDLL